MSVATPIQSDFSGGEIGALVQGRVDFDRYKKSCDTLLNWICTLQGAIVRRPGTKYVAATKYRPDDLLHQGSVNLIPFSFLQNQAYILEFGPGYLRAHFQEGPVLQGGPGITGITKAASAVITVVGHPFVVGQTVTISQVTGMAQINGLTGTITAKATNTITVNIDSTGFSNYVSGGSVVAIYEIPTSPYVGTTPTYLYTAQSNDTLYIANPQIAPYRLVRNSDGTFSFFQITFIDGPYLDRAVANTGLASPITMILSGVGPGNVTCTASAPIFASSDATSGGRSIRFGNVGATIGGITQANPAVVTTTASHGFVSGQVITISGVVGMTQINGSQAAVSVLSPTTFSLPGIGSTNFTAYSSGGAADAPNSWGWGIITAFASATSVTVNLQVPVAQVSQKTNWRLGVWSDTTGWPSSVVFHEGRLWWAGAANSPERVDGSNSGDYLNMTPTRVDGTVLATHAVGLVLTSGDLNISNSIVWMASNQKGLQCGSLGAEFVITPGSSSDFIQPTSVFSRAHSSYGSSAVKPVKSNRATIYAQRAGQKLREMVYFFSVDGFESEDLTVLNPEVTSSGIKQLAITREPYPIVWCLRNDGTLAAATYQRDPQSLRVAWHRHSLGGRSSANGDAPIIQAIAVIPTSTATPGTTVQDELWLCVERYIGGVMYNYIEVMTPFYTPYSQSFFHTPLNANFLDCSSNSYYQSGGNYGTATEIIGTSLANPAVIQLVAAAPFNVGDSIVVDGIQGTSQINGKVYIASRVTSGSAPYYVNLASANNGPPAAAITAITKAASAVVTAAGHGFSNGDTVTISGVVGMIEINGLSAVISAATADTFAMAVNSTGFSTYTSGGTALDLVGVVGVDATNYGVFLQTTGVSFGFVAAKTTTLNAGTQLNGETISVLADGAVLAGVGPVSAGVATLPSSGAFLNWGYPYNSDFRSLRADAGAQNGTSWGKTQKVARIGVHTYQQGNLRAGYDFDNLQLMQLPSSTDPAGVGHPLQSGHLTIQPPNGTPDLDVRLCIRASDPLPASILAIAPIIDTNDRT